MIQNDSQLAGTREALRHLEAAMLALKQDRPRLHPDRYALMADPVLDDLRRLRHEIDVYLGVVEADGVIGLNGTGCARPAMSQMDEQETVQAHGILREIDLDKSTFTLRNADKCTEIRCAIDPDNRDLLEFAKAGLDLWVTVTGVRRCDPGRHEIFPLTVQAIAVTGRE